MNVKLLRASEIEVGMYVDIGDSSGGWRDVGRIGRAQAGFLWLYGAGGGSLLLSESALVLVGVADT